MKVRYPPHPHMHLVGKLGGLAGLADKLDVKLPAVLHWRRRGIPHWRLPEVAKIARAAGIEVTTEDLMALKGPEARGGPRPRVETPAEAA